MECLPTYCKNVTRRPVTRQRLTTASAIKPVAKGSTLNADTTAIKRIERVHASSVNVGADRTCNYYPTNRYTEVK